MECYSCTLMASHPSRKGLVPRQSNKLIGPLWALSGVEVLGKHFCEFAWSKQQLPMDRHCTVFCCAQLSVLECAISEYLMLGAQQVGQARRIGTHFWQASPQQAPTTCSDTTGDMLPREVA
eukprot:631468-Amphidinium_carterae.1